MVPANAKTATATSVSNAFLNPNSVAAKLAQATAFGGVTSAAPISAAAGHDDHAPPGEFHDVEHVNTLTHIPFLQNTGYCSKPNEFTEFDNIDYPLVPDWPYGSA
jgi:hypothetical protein